MSWKDVAKKSPIIYSINAKIKSSKLKYSSVKLAKSYDAKTSKMGLEYNTDKAIADFKSRHHALNSSFKIGDGKRLNVFWVGSNQSQDESGFLQSLKRLTNVTVFRSFNGEYGSWDGEINGNISASFEEVRAFNSRALLEQISIAHNDQRIDFLFGQMWAHRLTKECLSKVRSMGIPTINISMDDRLPP